MDLVTALATACVRNQMTKRADPAKSRLHFEESARRENVLRSYAENLKNQAIQREENDIASGKGTLRTGLERLLVPVPRTGTEALLRGGAVAGGAYLGHSIGKQLEHPPESLVKSILLSSGKGGGIAKDLGIDLSRVVGKSVPKPAAMPGFNEWSSLGSPLSSAVDSGAKATTETARSAIANMPSGELLKALHLKKELPSWDSVKSTVSGLKGDGIGSTVKNVWDKVKGGVKLPTAGDPPATNPIFGDVNTKQIGESIKSHIARDKELAGQVSHAPSRWGAVGGAVAGAALSALPYALYAMYAKRHGGEGALRSKNKARKAEGQANNEQRMRERLLQNLKV